MLHSILARVLYSSFTGNLKKTHGKYTGKNVSRTSKFVGTVMRDLDHAFKHVYRVTFGVVHSLYLS